MDERSNHSYLLVIGYYCLTKRNRLQKNFSIALVIIISTYHYNTVERVENYSNLKSLVINANLNILFCTTKKYNVRLKNKIGKLNTTTCTLKIKFNRFEVQYNHIKKNHLQCFL